MQLPLGVQLRDDTTFANFHAGPNRALIEMLDQPDMNRALAVESPLYLYGESGSGCSHLLQASCHQIDRLGGRSSYLPLDELICYPPRIIEGFEVLDLVCLDAIEAIGGNRWWEEAIFNLFNELRENRKRLMVAAKLPPRQLQFDLPDLTSRLSWGLVYQMLPLDDNDKLQSLRLRAHLRGIDLSTEVARFILNRSPRDMKGLFAVLLQLDSASLRAKRKLSIPFVKEVMNW